MHVSSEPNQANDQLRALQGALDAAGLGSWQLDILTGDIQRSSRHDEIFGEPSLGGRWTLQHTLERVVAEDQDLLAQSFAEAESTGAIDLEVRIRGGDEQIRWVHINGRTFYEAAAAVSMAGVIADVTERRAVETRLRLAQIGRAFV